MALSVGAVIGQALVHLAVNAGAPVPPPPTPGGITFNDGTTAVTFNDGTTLVTFNSGGATP